jgi:hypothetical protein
VAKVGHVAAVVLDWCRSTREEQEVSVGETFVPPEKTKTL